MFKKMKIKRLEKKLAKLREEEKWRYAWLEEEYNGKRIAFFIGEFLMGYAETLQKIIATEALLKKLK